MRDESESESESEGLTIQQLPPEIIENIILQVEFSKAVYRLREVSKQWFEIFENAGFQRRYINMQIGNDAVKSMVRNECSFVEFLKQVFDKTVEANELNRFAKLGCDVLLKKRMKEMVDMRDCKKTLYFAAENNNYETSEYLMNNHCSLITERNGWYRTPLLIACYRGHLPIVQLLTRSPVTSLTRYVDYDESGCNEILCAVQSRNSEMVKYLLDHTNFPLDHHHELQPSHNLSIQEKQTFIRELIKSAAQSTDHGMSAMHIAVYNRDYSMLKTLLSSEFTRSLANRPVELYYDMYYHPTRTVFGTPLTMAAMNQLSSFIELLVDHNADPLVSFDEFDTFSLLSSRNLQFYERIIDFIHQCVRNKGEHNAGSII